jgi:uncharacterized membrane protein YagU involved in acid resistance
MLIISLIINTLLIFFILNIGYIRKKRNNPDYPDKPFSKLVIFPLALGIVFTLIVDVFKGIMIYQLALFAIAALLLYWIFYVLANHK